MATAGSRLGRRVRRDFPEAGSAPEILRLLGELVRQTGDEAFATERVQAAIVLLVDGSIRRFREAVDLGITDWPDRLDRELGPADPGSGIEASR